MNSLKKTIIYGTFWSIIGQFGYISITLITNVILARVLSPYIFGQIGIVMFFIILSNVLVEGGMGGALIRKIEVKNIDYSTVFIFNLLVSVILFLGITLASGYIAENYRDPSLKKILIVSAFILIINAFQLVHNIKLIRELKFKKKAIYNLCAIFSASLIGIWLAFNGFGVWSVVFIQLLNSIFTSILYWVFEGTFGKIIFSKPIFVELYKFGANTTISQLINSAFDNIYSLVLGRFFSINQVGMFYQSKRLQDVPSALVSVTASGIVYSSISKIQNDKEKFINVFNKIFIIYTIIIGFITIISFFYSSNFILILYGDKWVEAVYYMKLLSVVTFFYSLSIVNELLFKVYDVTKKILHIMFVRNIIQISTIILGVYYHNLNALIYGFIFSTFISFVLYYYYSRKTIHFFDKKEFLKLINVIVISIAILVFFSYLQIWLKLSGNITFVFAPFILFIYLFSIEKLQVFNIADEIKLILFKK